MHQVTIIAAITTAAALALLGCGAMAVGQKAYVAPSLRVDASKPQLMRAIARAARAEGLSIRTTHYRLGIVEAVSSTDRIGDTRTREHWYFFADQRKVRAHLVFEAKFDGARDGTWVSSPNVCDGYGYLRERQQLARIGRLAGSS